MYDTLILLAQPPERDTLAALLRQHNAQLDILTPNDKSDLTALPNATLARARLIGFLTPIVVPAQVLDSLGFGAYNFHPGPPSYPGWLPSHFAVYDGATTFGVTVHAMAREIDAGPIVGVDLFEVPPGTGVLELERETFIRCARLVWHFAAVIAADPAPLALVPVRWSGRRRTKAMLREMCDIPATIDAHELDRRIAAFGGGYDTVTPTVTLNGHTFRYVPPEQRQDAPGDAAPAAAAKVEAA